LRIRLRLRTGRRRRIECFHYKHNRTRSGTLSTTKPSPSASGISRRAPSDAVRMDMCSKRVVSELSTWQAEMAYRRRWFTFFVPHPPSGLGQTLRSFENAGRQKVRSLAKNWQTVLGMIACGCRSSSRDHDLHKTYNDCRTMLQHLSFTGCHACRGQLVKVPGKLQANSMLGIQLIKISKNRGEIISLHKSQISQLGYYCTYMHRAAVKFLPLHASALVAPALVFFLVPLSHTLTQYGVFAFLIASQLSSPRPEMPLVLPVPLPEPVPDMPVPRLLS